MINTKQIVRALSNPRIDRIGLACEVISSASSYKELQQIVKQIPLIHKGLFKFAYLKRKDYAHFNQICYPIISDSMMSYVRFVVYITELYHQEICQYIELRKKYEIDVLNGQYEQARCNLEAINCVVGHSYWGMEQSIKLERWANNVSASSQVSQNIIQENQKLSIFCNFFFNTSSIDFSFDDVIRIMYNLLSGMKHKDDDFYQYFASLTIPYNWSFSGTKWIQYYTQLSIVDLYNSLIDNIWKLDDYIKDNEFNECISHLIELTKDSYLIKFAYIHQLIPSPCFNEMIRTNIMQCFTHSDYEKVMALGETYIQENPTDFEIMDYVTRSYILSEASYQTKVSDNNSILQQIRYNYHVYLTHEDQYKVAEKKLRTICLSLYSFHCCRYLLNVIDEQEHALIPDIYRDTYQHVPFQSLFDIKPQRLHDSLDGQMMKSSKNEKIVYNPAHEVPFIFLKNDIFANMDIDAEDFSIESIAPYMRECAASTIFSHYIDTQQWKKAVLFYVKQKLEYKNLEIKYDKSQLETLFQDNVSGDMQIPLEMSIFYTMIDANAGTRFIAYKHYLKQLQVNCASEIININTPKLNYFLKYVADIRVLELHVRQFDTQDQVINERINICNNLFSVTKDKELAKEVADLVKGQEIKKLISTIDESKIYVDEEGLKKTGLEEERIIFALYQSMDSKVQVPDSMLDFYKQIRKGLENDKQQILKNLPADTSPINYKVSLFEQLYKSIRQKFLLDSKYGLEFFLSTRIRHGTLVNQLRKHFEEYSLITNLIDDNQYAVNIVWIDEKLQLSGKERAQMISAFDQFTRIVDEIILSIKNEVLQISFDEHNIEKAEALDYSLNTEIQNILDYNCKEYEDVDFTSCIDGMFQLLWKQTEDNLEKIKITLEQKHQMLNQALTNLASQVHKYTRESTASKSLLETIAMCSTSLQGDFAVVEKWLQRRDLKDFDYRFQNVLDTCTSIMSNMNMKLTRCDIDINSETIFRGKSFNYLYDITHELLNNVFNYQIRSHEELECKIVVKEEQEILHIQVSNKLLEEDIPVLNEKIKQKSKNDKGVQEAKKVICEGDSGIHKITNIVSYSLRDQHNSYRNYIKDNWFVADVKLYIKNLV